MPRASRKDRKVLRIRAANAADRGLPTPAIEPRGSSGSHSLRGPNSSEWDSATAALNGPSQAKKKGWFATRQLWVKVLGLATLALLGISLWRTLTASRETGSVNPPEAASAKAPAPMVNPGAVAPGSVSPQTGDPSR